MGLTAIFGPMVYLVNAGVPPVRHDAQLHQPDCR